MDNFIKMPFCLPKNYINIISKPININISRRFYPKGPNNKIIASIGQKCTGAGCGSTRNNPLNNASSSKNPTSATPTSTTSSESNPKISNNNNNTAYVPIKNLPKENPSISDKFKEGTPGTFTGPYKTPAQDNSPNNDNVSPNIITKEKVLQMSKTIGNNKTSSSNDTNIPEDRTTSVSNTTELPSKTTDLSPISNVTPENNGLDIGDAVLDSDIIPVSISKLANNIPTPPPLPKDPLVKSIPSSTNKAPYNSPQEEIKSFKHEDESSNINPKDIQKSLKDLHDRGLLKYDNDQEKVAKEFYKLPKEKHKTIETTKIIITEDSIKDITNFNIGILQVTENENNIFLKGSQMHVVVVYTVYENKKIVIGYLTSDKDATILLSKTQPFNFENDNKKEQRFAVMQEPLLVTQEQHVKNLESIKLQTGEIIDQQNLGESYINQPEIQAILKNQIRENIIPQLKNQNYGIQQYDGKGITMQEIDHAIKIFDALAEKKTEELLKTYKQFKNQGKINKINLWLKGQEQTLDNITFQKLKNKIDEYENNIK